MIFNMILAGVGGQGSVLLSQMIGVAAVEEGYHVAIGETFGTSQRHGDVLSQIRLSDEMVSAPWMLAGSADVIVGLEPLEALRAAVKFMNPSTNVMVNPKPVMPNSVTAGDAIYPDLNYILRALRENCKDMYVVEATSMAARELRDARVMNMIMAGALVGAGFIPLKQETMRKVIEYTLPPKIHELNFKAFDLGYRIIKEEIIA